MTTRTSTATAHITCKRCGRPLTSPRTIREALTNGGYGRGCAKVIEANVKAAATTEAQAAKVVDAIEAGAVEHRVRNLFQVVSSDGTTVYDVDLAAGSCTCKAGQYGRRCYHISAAAALAA